MTLGTDRNPNTNSNNNNDHRTDNTNSPSLPFSPSLSLYQESLLAAEALVRLLLHPQHGIGSPAKDVRFFALDLLPQICRSAPPEAIQPLLGQIVPALLEALSTMEDQRLNYLEQHAERWGISGDKLEGARVEASRQSPIGEVLEVANRLAVSKDVLNGDLIPELSALVKRAVGLNTKVGTARFIRQWAVRVGDITCGFSGSRNDNRDDGDDGGGNGGNGGDGGDGDGDGKNIRTNKDKGGIVKPSTTTTTTTPSPSIKQQVQALLRVLTSAAYGESGAAPRRAWASAAAAVLGCMLKSSSSTGSKGSRIEKWIDAAVDKYRDDSVDENTRLTSGLLLRELLRVSPELFQREAATKVLPLSFAARMDSSSSVSSIWDEIWIEGVSSEAGAVRLYRPEITDTLIKAFTASQWDRKRAAAAAVIHVVKVCPDAFEDSTDGLRLCDALTSHCSAGRLWDGKEALAEALGSLASIILSAAIKKRFISGQGGGGGKGAGEEGKNNDDNRINKNNAQNTCKNGNKNDDFPGISSVIKAVKCLATGMEKKRKMAWRKACLAAIQSIFEAAIAAQVDVEKRAAASGGAKEKASVVNRDEDEEKVAFWNATSSCLLKSIRLGVAAPGNTSNSNTITKNTSTSSSSSVYASSSSSALAASAAKDATSASSLLISKKAEEEEEMDPSAPPPPLPLIDSVNCLAALFGVAPMFLEVEETEDEGAAMEQLEDKEKDIEEEKDDKMMVEEDGGEGGNNLVIKGNSGKKKQTVVAVTIQAASLVIEANMTWQAKAAAAAVITRVAKRLVKEAKFGVHEEGNNSSFTIKAEIENNLKPLTALLEKMKVDFAIITKARTAAEAALVDVSEALVVAMSNN